MKGNGWGFLQRNVYFSLEFLLIWIRTLESIPIATEDATAAHSFNVSSSGNKRYRFLSGFDVTESQLKNNIHGAAFIGYAITSTEGFCVGVFINSKTFVTGFNSNCNYQDEPWSIYEGNNAHNRRSSSRGTQRTSYRVRTYGHYLTVAQFAPSLTRVGVNPSDVISHHKTSFSTFHGPNVKCVGFGYGGRRGETFSLLNTISVHLLDSFRECKSYYPFAKEGLHFCAEAKGPTDTDAVCVHDMPTVVMCQEQSGHRLDSTIKASYSNQDYEDESWNDGVQDESSAIDVIQAHSLPSFKNNAEDFENVTALTEETPIEGEEQRHLLSSFCLCSWIPFICPPCDRHGESSTHQSPSSEPKPVNPIVTATEDQDGNAKNAYNANLELQKEQWQSPLKKWHWRGILTSKLSRCNSHLKLPDLYLYVPGVTSMYPNLIEHLEVGEDDEEK